MDNLECFKPKLGHFDIACLHTIYMYAFKSRHIFPRLIAYCFHKLLSFSTKQKETMRTNLSAKSVMNLGPHAYNVALNEKHDFFSSHIVSLFYLLANKFCRLKNNFICNTPHSFTKSLALMQLTSEHNT